MKYAYTKHIEQEKLMLTDADFTIHMAHKAALLQQKERLKLVRRFPIRAAHTKRAWRPERIPLDIMTS